MALHGLRSAQSFRISPSCMSFHPQRSSQLPEEFLLVITSPSRIKQVLFGIIPIFLPNTVMAFGTV